MSDPTGAHAGVMPERDEFVPTTTSSPAAVDRNTGSTTNGDGMHATTESIGAVADTAKQEGVEVAREAGRQARELASTAKDELLQQTVEQQRKVADGLSSLEQELRSMARSAENPGLGADLADQAADRLGSVAGWLEQREPGQLVDEVRSFAARRPGAFLAAAAGIGLLAGRLTRSMASEASGTTSGDSQLDLRDAPDVAAESRATTPSRTDLGSEWDPGITSVDPGYLRGDAG